MGGGSFSTAIPQAQPSEFGSTSHTVYPFGADVYPVCELSNNSTIAQCMVLKLATPSSVTGPVGGYAPNDLRAAYGLTSSSTTLGTGQTVAVVVAYSNPNLASDLAAYRSFYGLPACTTASGCLKIVVEGNKNTTLPAVTGWAEETSLDVEMVSALCPLCKILVVDALTNSVADLAASVDTAVTDGATVVSNSFATTESGATAYESHWNHVGVPMVAGAGDSGYGVGFPASSRYVTAVGGTTLTKNSNGSFTSAVWSGTGAGCSAVIPKPTWQKDTGCKYRSENDLAVIADPHTGVAVYSYYAGGWAVFGGTSVGSPLVAAMYALAGNGKTLGINNASYLYSHGAWTAVTSGNDGTCSVAYLCTAGASGYSGPAGRGSPSGITAF
jgi:subtilase family serine protease